MDEKLKIPNCVGIIMDGNRRWARERKIPLLEGHRAGMESVKKIAKYAKEAGIKNLVLYTFSTENWNRAKEEVDYLMELFKEYFEKEVKRLDEDGAVVRIAGDIRRFAEDIQKNFLEAVEKTKNNTGLNVYFALNYGGREEILSAVKKIVKENPKEEEITQDYFSKFLQTYPMPDPDMIIRTSGEKRLSNFLPWQSIYSELVFVEVNWPDFDEEQFRLTIEEYGHRERRMGK